MLHYLIFIEGLKVGIIRRKIAFGIGCDKQPNVGWYLDGQGGSPDTYIPGFGYLFGKF